MSSFVPLKKRLAIIVSHPVQYYAPLYQRPARRTDLEIKVFFTWHAGQAYSDNGRWRGSQIGDKGSGRHQPKAYSRAAFSESEPDARRISRLGDVFVLPSKSCETWGLAVNEALACGRPVLVSDRVGCAADVADRSRGRVFPWNDLSALEQAINELSKDQNKRREMRRAAAKQSWLFDISRTEAALMVAAREVLGQ